MTNHRKKKLSDIYNINGIDGAHVGYIGARIGTKEQGGWNQCIVTGYTTLNNKEYSN